MKALDLSPEAQIRDGLTTGFVRFISRTAAAAQIDLVRESRPICRRAARSCRASRPGASAIDAIHMTLILAYAASVGRQPWVQGEACAGEAAA